MANLVDLKKKAAVVLAKRQVPKVTAQVGVAFDITGSMRHLYNDNTVQITAERLLGLAMNFDDNESLDSWAFDTQAYALAPITPDNHLSYVRDEILTNPAVRLWGATKYAPAFSLIRNHYFGDKPTKTGGLLSSIKSFFGKKEATTSPAKITDPVYVMFITDGENDDRKKAGEELMAMGDDNIYIQLIGLGTSKFSFCKSFADELPNVGFVHLTDITKMTDEDLYMELLNPEFCDWVRKFGGTVS